MKKHLKSAVLAVALSTGISGAALAAVVDLTGGSTAVTVTADLVGLGLTPGLTGTATANDAGAFVFDITGGTLDDESGAALIEHDGSGVSLTAGETSATVGDFLIDTTAGTVSGSLNGGDENVTFFDFGTSGDSGVELLISADLGGALTAVFGAPDLAGAQFGFAVPSPELGEAIDPTTPSPVPLPAALPLLLVGVGAMGFVGRRRRKS